MTLFIGPWLKLASRQLKRAFESSTNWQKETWKLFAHSLARWKMRRMGCHCTGYSGSFLFTRDKSDHRRRCGICLEEEGRKVQWHLKDTFLAVESLGPINSAGVDFLCTLGRHLCDKSGDLRETSFLFQRISIINQRMNAAAITGCFPVADENPLWQNFVY